jgi:hypothetical protein
MLPDVSQAGGGSIGAEKPDVSIEHAVCSGARLESPANPVPLQPKPKTARQFEAALRAIGFSKRQARAIAARGFRGHTEQQAPNNLVAAIERLARTLKD